MARRSLLALTLVLAAAGGLSACGQQENDVKQPGVAISLRDGDPSVDHGAKLFVERCSGCHTLAIVGSEGGATEIGNRERTDGPNFDVRQEDKQSVLFAIRNGGFSGAIMPENIVVGKDAEDVANFLSKYAGRGSGNIGAGSTGAEGAGG